jgi:hypothetical protein
MIELTSYRMLSQLAQMAGACMLKARMMRILCYLARAIPLSHTASSPFCTTRARRIRIWSLRAPHGNPIAATPQPSVRPIFGDRIHSSSHISSSALAHSASDSPWTRTFAEPVPALKFADRNETLGVYLGERKASDRRDNTASVESRMELEKAGDDARAAVSSRKAGLPALWIGTGPTVECFDFGRLV